MAYISTGITLCDKEEWNDVIYKKYTKGDNSIKQNKLYSKR